MNINNNKRRNFRPRPSKNGFRRRNNGSTQNQSSHFQSNNGNTSFNRNGSMTNPYNVEKTIQKFQQLAKDAQSMGDPVVVENYLQHADHYARRLAELNSRVKPSSEIAKPSSEIAKPSSEIAKPSTEDVANEKNSSQAQKKEEDNLEDRKV